MGEAFFFICASLKILCVKYNYFQPFLIFYVNGPYKNTNF